MALHEAGCITPEAKGAALLLIYVRQNRRCLQADRRRLLAQAAYRHALALYPSAFPGYDCAQTSGRLPFCVSVNVNQRINQQIFCSLCDPNYVSFFR